MQQTLEELIEATRHVSLEHLWPYCAVSAEPSPAVEYSTQQQSSITFLPLPTCCDLPHGHIEGCTALLFCLQ